MAVLLSENKFDVWYADPPWHFKTWSDKGRGKSPKYPTMQYCDIVALGSDIKPLLSDSAVLFLWVTYPFLEKAFPVMSSWGFKFKTVAFTWAKKSRTAEKWHMGTGYYTRANPEICLLGVRGSMSVKPSNRPPNLIVEPVEAHSQKPQIAYKNICKMYPNTRRIELFASKNSESNARLHDFLPLGFDIDGMSITEALRALTI